MARRDEAGAMDAAGAAPLARAACAARAHCAPPGGSRTTLNGIGSLRSRTASAALQTVDADTFIGSRLYPHGGHPQIREEIHFVKDKSKLGTYLVHANYLLSI